MKTFIVYSEKDCEVLYKGNDGSKADKAIKKSKGDVGWRRYTEIEGKDQIELMSINYQDGMSHGVYSRQVLSREDLKTLVDLL